MQIEPVLASVCQAATLKVNLGDDLTNPGGTFKGVLIEEVWSYQDQASSTRSGHTGNTAGTGKSAKKP